MNTFGFFKFEPSSGKLLAVSDTKFEDVEKVISWLEDNHAFPGLDSLILGVDTLTTEFHVQEDTLFAIDMNLIPTGPDVVLNDPSRVCFDDMDKNVKLLYI